MRGRDTGGPAFPPVHDPMKHESGMTLRDWFAGQHIAGTFGGQPGRHLIAENAARDAYELADAMLAERAKGGDA